MMKSKVMSTTAATSHPAESIDRCSRVVVRTPWRAAASLAKREVVRFLRQRHRVVGAVGQPVMFWLLFSAGMNQTFQMPGQRFGQYFVPGTLVLILLFTAIFATISIIEDRQAGFLQSVLVAPVPRWSIVLGKLLGGTTLAVGQGTFFLALSLVFALRCSADQIVAAFGLMVILAFGLTALGFCLAWRMDSTQGFHAVMNLLLMPMWLLSGAFFPIPQLALASSWSEQALHWVMRLNPVTYGVAGLRHSLLPPTIQGEATGLWLPRLAACWQVTVVFALAAFAVATALARRPTQGDLQ